MKHYLKCIDNWHGASLEPGDSNLCRWSPWGHEPRSKGTEFYI